MKYKKIFLIGKAGCGKSTVVNSIINKSSKRADLLGPSKTSNSTQSCTRGICLYYSSNCILIDTEGFLCGTSETESCKAITKILKSFEIGFNKIFFFIKDGRLSNDDRYMFEILRKLFGKNIHEYVELVISFCDIDKLANYTSDTSGDSVENDNSLESEESDVEYENEIYTNEFLVQQYRDLNSNDHNLNKFMENFSKIIIGNNESFANKKKDALFVDQRNSFRNTIVKSIDDSPDTEVFLKRNIFEKIEKLFWWVVQYFAKKKYFGDEAIFNEGMKEDSCVRLCGDICSICDEPVMNDKFLSPCHHWFHFDCLRTWARSKERYEEKCPNCKQDMKDFFSGYTTSIPKTK